MLLDRGPLWRQGSRPQSVDQAQDLGEQRSWDSNLRELKGDIAAMSHDLGADLDELVVQRGHGPVLDRLRPASLPP